MSRSLMLLVLGAALVGGCSSTHTTATWRDPAAQPLHLRRSLAVFMSREPGLRRLVEDKLAAQLPGGVPSYHVIPDEELSLVDSVRARVLAGEFDGAVIMRLVGVTTEVTGIAEPRTFYGYWGYWSAAYDPAYFTTNRVYTVETTLYSFRDDRLVWMTRSETEDPKNVSKLADKSVKHAVKKMRKDGLIR